MARTDVRGVEGLEAAIDRAKALVDAGADAIFPEAMRDLERVRGDARGRRRADPGQHDRVRQERAVHAPAARRRRGQHRHLARSRCCALAMGAAGRALDTLIAEGHLTSWLPEMQTARASTS